MNPRFFVTAGNTREPIDHVRDWGNIFTGQTGLDIALALLDLGDVLLLTSNLTHAQQFEGATGARGRLETISFRSHADLLNLLSAIVPAENFDAVLMTAAIADYRPTGVFHILSDDPLPDGTRRWTVQNVDAPKVPSTFDQIAIKGLPTPKLVDFFRKTWNFRGILVKFKLQAGISEPELLAIAEKSRRASLADYIVANTLDMVQGKNPAAWILGTGEKRRVDRPALPRELARLLQGRLQLQSATSC